MMRESWKINAVFGGQGEYPEAAYRRVNGGEDV